MASGRMRTVVRRLRETALVDAGLADGELLERFLARRDESAFAALVRRHGPMVLGVCRRILRDAHDADDAFQATFLVLVRKAHSIIPRARVGPWLYGVAYRTSLKAKAMSNRRRARQKVLQDVPGPAPSAHEEWLDLLDREVNRLPDKYRLPIVLCDLQGKTRKQAARQLGWPEGTVATRLQQGRALVQKRLARHGLPLSAGAIMLVWAEAISAASVPARLLASTVQNAAAFAAGALAGSIPLNVIALVQGVLKAMVLTRAKNATALVTLVGILGLGAAGLSGSARPAAGQESPRSTPTQPVPTFRNEPPPSNQLPVGPAPMQALVSLQKGKVVVRTNLPFYQPRTSLDAHGRPITVYEQINRMNEQRYERDEVEVYDMRRRKLDNRDINRWLMKEIPALVMSGQHQVDPLHLRLYKEDTLLFILLAPPTPPLAAAPPAAPAIVAPTAPTTTPSHYVPPQLTPPATPVTGAPVFAVPQTPPATGIRIEQAERDLAIAEFYLKTGHRTSAVYYYELVQRRHAGTGYARKAADLLRELRRQEQSPRSSETTAARIGQIFIVGNTRVPDTTIRDVLDIYPGQVLDYKQVRAAEEKLRGLKDLVNVSPIVNIRPTITVLESSDDSSYRDILVTVHESLRLDVLDELEKLSGAWTTISATVVGKELPNMQDFELVFQGDRVTTKRGKSDSSSRCSVTLDLAAKPKGIRLTPLDGPAGTSFYSAGTYEIAGDTLKLSLRTGSGPSTSGSTSPEMVLTLKRKTGELIPGTAETRQSLPPSVQDNPNPRIILDLSSKGLKITAESLDILPGGHVKLTDATITRQRPGQPPQVLSGKRILITFDGPVRNFSDLSLRQILTIDADGASLTLSPK